jgi:hypothetical protein
MNEEGHADEQAAEGTKGNTPIQAAEVTNTVENAKPATQQQLAEVKQELTGFEKATLRWTRTTAGIGLVTAVFICLQWCEMRSGGIDTHTLAETSKLTLRPRINGSEQEFDKRPILGRFPENDKFGLGDGHALSLE